MEDLTKLELPEMNLNTRVNSGAATPVKSQENPRDVAVMYSVSIGVDVNDLFYLFIFL